MREDTVGIVASIVQVMFSSLDSSGGHRVKLSLYADQMVAFDVRPSGAALDFFALIRTITEQPNKFLLAPNDWV